MFNVPEVCRRAEEAKEQLKLMKNSLQTSRKSPLQQIFKFRRSSSGVRKLKREDSTAAPEFPLANTDDRDDIPLAPPPPVFTLGSLSAVDEESVPSLAQAAAHLALLECFWTYRDRFAAPDEDTRDFFGRALGWSAQKTWSKEDGEVLWKVVVEVAVARFEAWSKAVGTEIEADKWGEERGGEGGRWKPENGPSATVTELPTKMLPPLGSLFLVSASTEG